MELLFTGTGASEWDPDNRLKSNYRRKSSLLIDRELIVDAGPDIFTFEADFAYQSLYSEVETIVQTHSHRDHLSPDNIAALCADHTRIMMGDKAVLKHTGDIAGLEKIPIEPYVPVTVGRYIITAVEANHPAGVSDERPFHYIIVRQDKRIFYGCDGAWLLFRTWSYLRKMKFNLIILDGTTGEMDGNLRNFEHNNLAMVRLLAKTFRENRLLTEDGKIMITHMAMSLHGTHAKLEESLIKDGVIPAFDGMSAVV